MQNSYRLAGIVAFGLFYAPSAYAADTPVPMSPEQAEGRMGDWTFAVNPY